MALETTSDRTRDEIQAALAAPFPLTSIGWLPKVVDQQNARALAVPYLVPDAVDERLDEVFGVGNWQTTYRPHGNGQVCTLMCRIDGDWFTHEDYGTNSRNTGVGKNAGPAERAAAEDEKIKGAFTDAKKRAARRLGVGRYLGRWKSKWHPYDPNTRKWKGGDPKLTPEFLPANSSGPKTELSQLDREQPPVPAGERAPAPTRPQTRAQLLERLAAFEREFEMPEGMVEHFVSERLSQEGMALDRDQLFDKQVTRAASVVAELKTQWLARESDRLASVDLCEQIDGVLQALNPLGVDPRRTLIDAIREVAPLCRRKGDLREYEAEQVLKWVKGLHEKLAGQQEEVA